MSFLDQNQSDAFADDWSTDSAKEYEFSWRVRRPFLGSFDRAR